MPEPITTSLIAGIAAKAILVDLSRRGFRNTATRVVDKLTPSSSRTRVEKALEAVYAEAVEAFLARLTAGITLDVQASENLKTMVEDERWTEAMVQLIEPLPERIDTRKCLELFDGLKPPGTTVDDFDPCWQALVARFEVAFSASTAPEVRTLRQFRIDETQTGQLERIASGMETLVDATAQSPLDAKDDADAGTLAGNRTLHRPPDDSTAGTRSSRSSCFTC